MSFSNKEWVESVRKEHTVAKKLYENKRFPWLRKSKIIPMPDVHVSCAYDCVCVSLCVYYSHI